MNVYDFDNTIYNGESTFHLFLFYLKRNPRLVKWFPEVVRALRRYKKGAVSVAQLLEEYVPTVNAVTAQIVRDTDAAEFWDKHEKNIKPFYKKQQRPDDLIITASPDFTMREICRRIGVTHLLCTETDPDTRSVRFICMKENKRKAFRERYGGEPIENFYTDSPENDHFLIEMAEHAYVIKGNNIKKIK